MRPVGKGSYSGSAPNIVANVLIEDIVPPSDTVTIGRLLALAEDMADGIAEVSLSDYVKINKLKYRNMSGGFETGYNQLANFVFSLGISLPGLCSALSNAGITFQDPIATLDALIQERTPRVIEEVIAIYKRSLPAISSDKELLTRLVANARLNLTSFVSYILYGGDRSYTIDSLLFPCQTNLGLSDVLRTPEGHGFSYHSSPRFAGFLGLQFWGLISLNACIDLKTKSNMPDLIIPGYFVPKRTFLWVAYHHLDLSTSKTSSGHYRCSFLDGELSTPFGKFKAPTALYAPLRFVLKNPFQPRPLENYYVQASGTPIENPDRTFKEYFDSFVYPPNLLNELVDEGRFSRFTSFMRGLTYLLLHDPLYVTFLYRFKNNEFEASCAVHSKRLVIKDNVYTRTNVVDKQMSRLNAHDRNCVTRYFWSESFREVM